MIDDDDGDEDDGVSSNTFTQRKESRSLYSVFRKKYPLFFA